MNKFIVVCLLFVAVVALGCGKSSNYRSPAWQRPYLGLATSSVTVVEYSDFQCPACKAVQPIVKEMLVKFGTQVRFEYHHFPLTQIHRYANDAAVASECAADQNKFWEYHDRLFEEQPEFSQVNLIRYASELGLNVDTFAQCLNSSDPATRVKSDANEATKLKLPGTPSFLINGRPVADPSQLEALLLAAGLRASSTSN
jgi:protein-disulfide isomerase